MLRRTWQAEVAKVQAKYYDDCGQPMFTTEQLRDKCLFSAERVEGSKEELIARCIRIDLYQEFRDKCKEFSMKELRSQCAAAGVSADDVLDAFDTDEVRLNSIFISIEFGFVRLNS